MRGACGGSTDAWWLCAPWRADLLASTDPDIITEVKGQAAAGQRSPALGPCETTCRSLPAARPILSPVGAVPGESAWPFGERSCPYRRPPDVTRAIPSAPHVSPPAGIRTGACGTGRRLRTFGHLFPGPGLQHGAGGCAGAGACHRWVGVPSAAPSAWPRCPNARLPACCRHARPHPRGPGGLPGGAAAAVWRGAGGLGRGECGAGGRTGGPVHRRPYRHDTLALSRCTPPAMHEVHKGQHGQTDSPK